ncbi:MAG: hypothetical protein HKN47_13100 [Pirellulaceae bacterium]|nr:hypothetical protein [Pirellulaceae bacterium]
MPDSHAIELMPPGDELLTRYRELCKYVGLGRHDVQRAQAVWILVEPHVASHVNDFYAEILKHQETSGVFTGGDAQVERLKASLRCWIAELFCGNFDQAFVQNRWIVGWRHVQIGLPQIWTASAMSRLRDRILNQLAVDWTDSAVSFQKTASAISRLMDLDLALIQDAYHAESVATQLRDQRDFAEAIIGTTQSIVLVVDQDGKILRGNRYLSRLVCGESELPASIDSVQGIIPEGENSAVLALLGNQGDQPSPSPIVTQLIDNRQRHRTVRWFCRSIHHFPDSRNQSSIEAKLLVGQDITDLSEAQRRAVQQGRLAAIGQTMAGLAHESRNAFQRSLASLEALSLEVSDRPEAVELIARIQRAHDHLLHLYEEVLQFAKPVVLEVDKNRISDLVSRTWKHIAQASNCDPNRLRIEQTSTDDRIDCDAFKMEQVLRNVIENALSVSPAQSNIDVLVADTWQGDHESIRVTVRDYGPGISDEIRGRIFEPFFSTRSRGTGLGLPIARRLAEAHGGSLILSSTDSGTTAELIVLKHLARKQSLGTPQSE